MSSIEQAAGTSLAEQQAVIRRYAEAKGWPAPEEPYVEAESGIGEKLERRDRVNALMADVRTGDMVLVDKIDRWSRDPEFTYRSVRQIHGIGAKIYFIGDGCDPSTNEGDSMLGFRILLAREEHKRIKERLVGTRNRLQREGYYAAGVTPLGYRRPTDPKNRLDKNVLVIDPEEAELVRSIFRRYLAGESMLKLAKSLDVTLDRVKDCLDRRLYTGEVQLPPSAPGRKDGEWIKGRHEPIISRHDFDRVQEVIAERTLGGPRPRDAVSETSTWIARDVARCGHCGAKMGAAYAGKKGPNRRHYYRCSKMCHARGPRENTGSYIRIDAVEEAVSEGVQLRLERLRATLAKPHTPAPAAPAKNREAEREKLRQRRARHLEAHAAGLATIEELRASLAKVDTAIAKLDAAEAQDAKPSPLADKATRLALLAEVKEIGRALGSIGAPGMRAIVNALVVRVLVSSAATKIEWHSDEVVAERLAAIREALVDALGRAPSWSEVLDRLLGDEMVSSSR